MVGVGWGRFDGIIKLINGDGRGAFNVTHCPEWSSRRGNEIRKGRLESSAILRQQCSLKTRRSRTCGAEGGVIPALMTGREEGKRRETIGTWRQERKNGVDSFWRESDDVSITENEKKILHNKWRLSLNNKQNGAWKPPEYQQGRHLYLPCRCCWWWAAHSHTSSPSCDGWPWPLHQRLTDVQLPRTNTSVHWRMHTFHIKVGAHLTSRGACGRQGNGWGGQVRTRGQGSRSMKRCRWERKRRERRRSGKLSCFLHQLNRSTEKSGWNGHKKRGRWFKSRPRRGARVKKSRKVEKNSLDIV